MFGRIAAWWGAASLAIVLALVPARSPIERDFSPVEQGFSPVEQNLQSPADIIADAVTTAFAQDEPPASGTGERGNPPLVEEPAAPVAGASASVEPPIAQQSSPVPFGLATIRRTKGDVFAKWTAVKARIAADNETLARCRTAAQHCPAAAQKFLAIVRQGTEATGRARIAIINRAINLAIEPMSDLAQWGVVDRWSPPLETFATGRGDCEDYAIAKYVALTAAGVPPEDVKLVLVHNTALNEDHAVAAVRLDGDWVMLDNRWLTLVADNAMRQIIPLFVLDDDGVQKLASPALAGSPPTPAPASL